MTNKSTQKITKKQKINKKINSLNYTLNSNKMCDK